MKRLLLLRHAKSLADGTMTDKLRPLNARGRSDAPRMGIYMHHERYAPQLVLCSPARRTIETWELLGPELDAPMETRYPEALYLAASTGIQKLVRATADNVSALLVIGHNPGLEECAQALARHPASEQERELGATLQGKFPTCALAALEFDVSTWAELAPASGTLVDFVRPRDLKDE
jgi:phosphohistidine phosphatase